jgi:hypothetical protein
VFKLLTNADQIPSHVARGLVEALQAAEALAASGILADVPWAPGTACSVSRGAFAGHPGVVVSVTRGIAHVALMLFGHVRDVTVSVDCLVARE